MNKATRKQDSTLYLSRLRFPHKARGRDNYFLVRARRKRTEEWRKAVLDLTGELPS